MKEEGKEEDIFINHYWSSSEDYRCGCVLKRWYCDFLIIFPCCHLTSKTGSCHLAICASLCPLKGILVMVTVLLLVRCQCSEDHDHMCSKSFGRESHQFYQQLVHQREHSPNVPFPNGYFASVGSAMP